MFGILHKPHFYVAGPSSAMPGDSQNRYHLTAAGIIGII